MKNETNQDKLGFSDWVREKLEASNSLYYTYIFFLISWNWKFFHVLFIENHELLKTTRIEYVYNNIFFSIDLPQKINHLENVFNFIINFSWKVLPPIFFTYIAIIYFSEIKNKAHAVGLKFFFQRKLEFDKQERDYEKDKTKLLREIKETTKINKSLKYEIIDIKSDKPAWEEEFKNLSKTNLDRLRKVNQEYYANAGGLTDNFNNFYIDPASLSYADTNGLISIDNKNKTFSLTDKGKYFVSMLDSKN